MIPDKDRAWLEEVASYACCVCNERDGVQAHHLRECGAGCMSKKPPDVFCVPLCVKHHALIHRARLTSAELVEVYRCALVLIARYFKRTHSVEAVLGEEGF